MDFFHSTVEKTPLTGNFFLSYFLDGLNGLETLTLSRGVRLLSQSDEGWGDERLTQLPRFQS